MRRIRQRYLVTAAALSAVLAVGITASVSTWAAETPQGTECVSRFHIVLAHLKAIEKQLLGVTQNWDKKLDSTNGEADGCNSDRFTCIWPTVEHPTGSAVRDNETGLVWPRAVTSDRFEWAAAVEQCAKQELAYRFGWHLPTVEQLASLLDNSATGPVALPDGHPFTGFGPSNFWTATAEVEMARELAPRIWVVVTAAPPLGHLNTQEVSPENRNPVFCVRGGETYDGQDVQRVIEALP